MVFLKTNVSNFETQFWSSKQQLSVVKVILYKPYPSLSSFHRLFPSLDKKTASIDWVSLQAGKNPFASTAHRTSTSEEGVTGNFAIISFLWT